MTNTPPTNPPYTYTYRTISGAMLNAEPDSSDMDLIVIDSPGVRPPSGAPPPLPASLPTPPDSDEQRAEYTRIITSGYLYRTDSLLTSLSRTFTSLVMIDFFLFFAFLLIFISSPSQHIIFLFHFIHLPRTILGYDMSQFIFPDVLQRLDSSKLRLYQGLGVISFADFFKVVMVEFHDEVRGRDLVVAQNKLYSRKNKVLGWTVLTLLCVFFDFCALMVSMFGIER